MRSQEELDRAIRILTVAVELFAAGVDKGDEECQGKLITVAQWRDVLEWMDGEGGKVFEKVIDGMEAGVMIAFAIKGHVQ